MRQPQWKIWLSYLTELHIESAASELNPHLYVSLRQGRYQLSTANAVYSYGDLYTNFLRVFRELDLERLPIDRVLLLGLGLGSIPLMLERVFQRRYHFTAVEIDEAVLYLAGKYALDELESGVELIAADARAFVAQTDEQFDLICMDIFLDDVIPERFEERAFLEDLAERLAPGGVLLYNRLAATRRDKEKSRAFYEQQFRPVFPSATFLDVHGNYILINRRDALRKHPAFVLH